MHIFLLLINSNISPVSHCFGDMATYRMKIVNFDYTASLFCRNFRV